ncbi:MAG: hypothetical protein HOH20_09970 [Rhodospirillaceae bacterium]|jgi:superfamily I DNA/RNA helicase|nr:hypothetical protein [Rhodospirillaceae bacterium]MBT5564095.1 hypothetical protein [Rhodospirillaceae bacterium]MBT6089892.1 hypothetical protein [Rhodospirillaceae bacterium]
MSISAKHTVATKEAAKRFLYDVVEVVEKNYPVWENRLASFLEDSPLEFEEKRRLLETHPVRHYFYAVIVGMEASKIRSLYQADIAEDLLADINELVDQLAGRSDQLVSDLVFDVMRRVRVVEADDTKKEHDVAMKRISELLQLTTMEATKDLTKDVVFRQEMAQPIAASMRHWWNAFKSSRQLAQTIPAPTSNPAESGDTAHTVKIATVH